MYVYIRMYVLRHTLYDIYIYVNVATPYYIWYIYTWDEKCLYVWYTYVYMPVILCAYTHTEHGAHAQLHRHVCTHRYCIE